jgi:DUF4097 and DUF4098 domain-containing protein YvlB
MYVSSVGAGVVPGMGRLNMYRKHYTATSALVVVLVLAALATGETTRKEYRFKVGRRHAAVSIINQYGTVSVKSGSGKAVLVVAILYSDKVEIDPSKNGSRVTVLSHLFDGASADSGRVDYEVQVPADTSLTVHSATGPVRVEKVHGDVVVETNTASVDIRDITSAHIHVKTLNGPVTLTNVTTGHVEITSVSGDVALNKVTGPLVQVNSSSGQIHYDGDFSEGGEYSLSSHSGDIEAVAPSYASIDVVARSAQGKVENDFLLQPEHSSFVAKFGSSFMGTMGEAASSVKLLSFSGKIHLKKR